MDEVWDVTGRLYFQGSLFVEGDGNCLSGGAVRGGEAGLSTELLDIAALLLHGSFLVEKGGALSVGGDVGLSTELIQFLKSLRNLGSL
jgi:hypothetical protein